MLGWALHVIREENAGRRPHISLTGTIGQTIFGLAGATIGAWMISAMAEAFARIGGRDEHRAEQASGEMLITLFVLIYLCMAFSGYFTSIPEDERQEMEYLEPWK